MQVRELNTGGKMIAADGRRAVAIADCRRRKRDDIIFVLLRAVSVHTCVFELCR